MKFKKVRDVTLPAIKLELDHLYYLRFDTAFVSKEPKAVADKPREAPMQTALVTNMESGDRGQLIAGEILFNEIVGAYPGEAYVGRIFEIVKEDPKVPGKRYKLYRVTEVSMELESESATVAPIKGRK
jgi:hypothetical protein